MKVEVSGSIKERSPGVKSASRVLDVLEYFAQTAMPTSLARLCVELDMPKSSCHAMRETLRSQGYVYWLGREEGYYPTGRWRDLGDAISRHDPILSLVSEKLQNISVQTSETAILAKLEDSDVLYLDVVEPDRTLRFTAHIGQIKPLHSAASGRSLLALMNHDERCRVLTRLPLQAFSANTVTNIDSLLKMIVDGQINGYHVAIGEYQPDTTAIAVGFRIGAEAYSLLVGGPTHRLEERVEEIGQLLVEQAKDIESLQ